MACSAATREEKKEVGGLIRAVALAPPDPGHPFHNWGDEGPDLRQVSVFQQVPEDVGEPDGGVAEDDLHQPPLKGPGDGFPRLLSQLLWDRFPEMLEHPHQALKEGS